MKKSLISLNRSSLIGFSLAAFVFVVLPMVTSAKWVSVFTSTACFTLAVAGVAFMYARLGMVSLTQVGLMGVGGWVTLRLNYWLDLPFEFNMLLASAATVILGMVLALPALRLRGLYLALVTLMAAGGLAIIFSTFQFPNGGDGFWGVQTGLREPVRRPAIASSNEAYMRYTIFFTVLGFILLEVVRRLSPGRAWALIRRSEAAAMAAGVNITLHKTIAFALSGLVAGVAGALLAGSLGLLDSATFGASESILLFALAVVGGARYWLGVVIASALFRILPALLNDWSVDVDLAFVIFGAGLLHAVITAPDGISGQIVKGIERFARTGGDLPAVDPNLISTLTSGEPSDRKSNTICVDNVSVRFGGVIALDSVSAEFTKTVSGIIGPNGAGKTTLMNVLSGFLLNSEGRIEIDGENILTLAPYKRAKWGLRRSFQKEEVALDLTVAENVLVQLDTERMSFESKISAVASALEIVGLSAKSQVLGESLNNFERRLTDVAKAIVGQPKLVVFDEPAGGLSVPETQKLGEIILNISHICGAQVLVIDHDVDLIARICEETLVLDFGKKIAFGPTAEVLSDQTVKDAYLGQEEGMI